MALNISGINIINADIRDTSDAIRALLTTSLSSYDAATIGNFITITATEYASIANSLAYTTKLGMTDAQMGESGTAWTGYCASVLPSANSSVSAGSYIVACTMRNQNTTVFRPLFNTVHPGSNSNTSFTSISNAPTISSATGQYYLVRKKPPVVTANGFVGHVGGSTGTLASGTTIFSGSGVNNGYYACVVGANPPFTPWTGRNSTQPMVQWLICSTQQW